VGGEVSDRVRIGFGEEGRQQRKREDGGERGSPDEPQRRDKRGEKREMQTQ
jgi:hypothetical protein